MRIIQLRTPHQNIGNGVIDLGANAAIRSAVPSADLIEVSGYTPSAAASLSLGEFSAVWSKLGRIGAKFWANRAPFRADRSEVEITDLVEADVAILSGCVLSRYSLGEFRPTLQRLSDRGIPIVILGGGGVEYDDPATTRFVERTLERLNVQALFTRDPRAHELYGDAVPRVYEGIDCGFHVADAYQPPDLQGEFIAMTVDKGEEPESEPSSRVIRPCHLPYGYGPPFEGLTYTVVNWFFRKRTQFQRDNWFVAERPEDYLLIYANAHKTITDRLHACVPALAYGNEAQFITDTERASLLDRFLGPEIRERPVSIDTKLLEAEKREQVQALSDAIEEIAG